MKTSSEVEAFLSDDGMEAMVKGWASKAKRKKEGEASFRQFREVRSTQRERKGRTQGGNSRADEIGMLTGVPVNWSLESELEGSPVNG